ncbi:hypothetical protein ACHHV8_24620 [Paenibacillus sp. TAB 01]|uniref:hypothetical protein n=1 Tax=Paenibacillus sp. TAB 01 TaxID=3368988 RepID=UPI0037509746
MENDSKQSNGQGISIGVIGPEEAVRDLLHTLQRFPSFQPAARTYRSEEEAPALALELMDQVEVLLFTGPIPYRIAADRLQFSIPVHFVPLTGTGLYRALFLLEKRHGLKTLSVDTMTKKQVDRIFKELSEMNVEVVYYKGLHPYSKEELVRFHVRQYQSGACQAVLTAVKSVSEELTRLGIPNQWVVPTEQDMIVSLERALLSTETRRGNESQIVVGMVHLDGAGDMINRRFTEHDLQKLKLEVHKMLLAYVESLDAHLTHLGGDEYLFITTRGSFERVTGGYKYISLAGEAEKMLGITFSIGIGFGRSAGEAGTHARLALRQAKEAGGNHCFIVRDGPRPHRFAGDVAAARIRRFACSSRAYPKNGGERNDAPLLGEDRRPGGPQAEAGVYGAGAVPPTGSDRPKHAPFSAAVARCRPRGDRRRGKREGQGPSQANLPPVLHP